jgi:hypothetical protein
VVSVGARGYGTDQELLALEEYLARYRANIVVLWETSNNDVWNNLFPTHQPRNGPPKPTFWLEGSRLAGPHQRPGETVPALRLEALVRVVLPRDADGDWERAHLPPPYRPIDPYTGPVERQVDIAAGDHVESEKSPYSILFAPRSPRMAYGVQLTNRLLHAIKDAAARHGAALLVFTTTGRPLRYDEWVYRIGAHHYRISERELWRNLDEMHDGIPFASVPVTVPDHLGPDGGHLNARGNDQVMADLAATLVSRGLLAGGPWRPPGG